MFGGRPIGQPMPDLVARSISDLYAGPFECARRRGDDATAPAFLHRQFGQINQSVILARLRQQPAGQVGSHARAEGTKPKSSLWHKFEIAIADGEQKIPVHHPEDHLGVELSPLELFAPTHCRPRRASNHADLTRGPAVPNLCNGTPITVGNCVDENKAFPLLEGAAKC